MNHRLPVLCKALDRRGWERVPVDQCAAHSQRYSLAWRCADLLDERHQMRGAGRAGRGEQPVTSDGLHHGQVTSRAGRAEIDDHAVVQPSGQRR